MAVVKLFNIFAFSSLAILACSFWYTPANALSIDSHHLARHNARGHDAIAIKKRSDNTKRSNNTKRCKPRSKHNNATSASPPPSPAKAKQSSPQLPAKPNPPSPAKVKAVQHDVPQTLPSPSSAPSHPAATPASTPASNGGKLGIAWANGDDPSLSKYKTSKTQYLYTWSPHKPPQSDALGFQFMPMLWCYDQIADFKRLVVKDYAHIVLGMNEPNEAGQCNISPQAGADLWRQYIEPLKDQGYALFTPAVSSSPAGKVWMQEFFKACTGCTFSVMTAHWYDKGAQKFIDYMTDFHNTFHMDIAVTEFACQNYNTNDNTGQCTSDEIFAFMTKVIRWCEATPWIHSCMPFGFMHQLQGVNTLDGLMNTDGSPSPLGSLVISGAA